MAAEKTGLKIYYDKDADLKVLKGKKIAIIGYGSQGHAQAQNLRDSGLNVVVAEMAGTDNYKKAVADGFKPLSASEAAKDADWIQMLVPDQTQAKARYDNGVLTLTLPKKPASGSAQRLTIE